MEVIKSDGSIQKFDIQKIRKQIEFACRGTKVNPIELESQLKLKIKNRIKTSDIQENLILSSVLNIDKDNYEWNKVAGKLNMWDIYRNVRKNTKISYDRWEELLKYLVRNGYYRKDVLEKYESLSKKTIEKINKIVSDIENKNYDFKMVYSQTAILKSKYLIKNKRGVIEYPFMSDIANALLLSENDKEFLEIFKSIHYQYISLATPFKANLRRPNGNVGSCFIGEMGDFLPSIMKSYNDMAFISQQGGGIGWYLGKVRPGGTYTENTPSSNIINKWIRIINDIAVAVNQGRNNRPGAITVALDWWHLDIFDFLSIKSELDGDLRDKAFDIFPQIVLDDFIIDKIKNNEDVYLFNHYEYKKITGIDITELVDEKLYKAIEEAQEFVKQGKISGRKINAKKDLWKKTLITWIEVGDFYMVHKDNLNKSNYLKYDENGGVTKCANLCTESFSLSKLPTKWLEEVENEKRVTSETNGLYHSCNLLSLNVANFVKKDDKFISKICELAVRILDKSIDEGEMPVLEAKKSSQFLRNIGIGIVGLADYMAYYQKLYDKEDGQEFAEKFVEKISYYTYKASIKLAEEIGAYPLFRPENYTHLFGYKPEELEKMSLNGFKWSELIEEIKQKGIRNFYLLALAPNSSTGILMGSTASYLPVYNIEMYQTLNDLSVPIIPKFISEKLWFYKTKFQYHPRDIIKFTRRIQKWIDTGISMEININPDIAKINEISDAILEGFDSKELKAVYYSLTINKTKEDNCVMCAN